MRNRLSSLQDHGRYALLVLLLAFMPHITSAQSDSNVVVQTMDQFLSAIESNTTITLDSGIFNVTDIDPQSVSSPYIEMRTVTIGNRPDQTEIAISGVSDLHIRSIAGKERTWFVNEGNYAHVLVLENVTNVTIEGVTFGHYPEQGTCRGGVIVVENSSGVNLNNCRLFGSGVFGLASSESEVLFNSGIVDGCTNTAITAQGGSVAILNSVFVGNTGPYFRSVISLSGARATIVSSEFYGNIRGLRFDDETLIIDGDEQSRLNLFQNTFSGNEFDGEVNPQIVVY